MAVKGVSVIRHTSCPTLSRVLATFFSHFQGGHKEVCQCDAGMMSGSAAGERVGSGHRAHALLVLVKTGSVKAMGAMGANIFRESRKVSCRVEAF